MSIFSTYRKTVWCGVVIYIDSINLLGIAIKPRLANISGNKNAFNSNS